MSTWSYTLRNILQMIAPNKINNVGPTINPCGTPEITGLSEENSLPITTRCNLFLKLLTKLRRRPSMIE